jgi:hypothetical protein
MFRLREAHLKLIPEKEIWYIGHTVTSEGITTKPEKLRAVQELLTPKNMKSEACWAYARTTDGYF